ncbi:MAG: energy transducer TonB [Desulfobacteraceae bacterium]|nr:MAG: energy transducer TonB [Desulfobacteraceae bacterium]
METDTAEADDMKHIFLAQTMALMLHGALFMIQVGGLPLQQAVPLTREICVELVAPVPEVRQAEARVAPTPRVEPERKPAAPPVVRRPEKPQPRPKPAARQDEQPAMASALVEAATRSAASDAAPEAAEQPVMESAPAVPAEQILAAAAGPPVAAPGTIAAAPQLAGVMLAAFPAPAAGGNGETKQEVIEACPLYRQNPPPDYPPLARKRGLEGTVELDVLVSPAGTADTVRLALTSGHDLLDRAALSAVEKWLFQPGKKGEETAAMWVRVPVRFALHK